MHRLPPLSLFHLILTLCLPIIAFGSPTLNVDPDAGDDKNNGRSAPVKTINRAIELAQPGDTIQLKKATYHETVDFSNKHGLPKAPITLEGNGSVIDGSRELDTANWRQVYPGTYRAESKSLYPKGIDNDIVSRFFMIWNGQLNRMGRCAKLDKNQPLQDTRHIMKNEWTYSWYYNAFFLVIGSNEKLADRKIRFPALKNAFVINESASHLQINNLTSIRAYGNGFDLSGKLHDVNFEYVGAMDCGDNGFSVAGNAKVAVNGIMSIGNGTGIYDTGESETHYTNVMIKDSVAYDLYFKGKHHHVTNGVIDSAAPYPIMVDADGDKCTATTKHLRITKATNITQSVKVAKNSQLNADNSQFLGFDWLIAKGGEVDLQECSIGDSKVLPTTPDIRIASGATWKGNNNRYNLRALSVGDTSFTKDSFTEFQLLTQSESASKWASN